MPTKLDFDENFTAIVGKNDAGKSTILEALDIFFGNAKPEVSDFTVGEQAPIRIICTFDSLPENLVLDATHLTTLADEYLLDENEHLSLGREWTRSKPGSPSIFVVANHPALATGEELITLNKAQLEKSATKLGVDPSEVTDKRTNAAFRKAIWRSTLREGSAELKLREVPLESADAKKVGEQLNAALPIYQLFKSDRVGSEKDDLAQNPAKAVVQDVLAQYQETLDELTETLHEKISFLLADVVDKLEEVAPNLADALAPANMKPNWAKAYSALEFVDDSGIPLSKRGAGTRRLVLLSFFRSNAEDSTFVDDSGYHRGIITAVEEPETALHADLQLEILGSLSELASHAYRQVVVTTHSANLVKDMPFRSIRFIKRIAEAREIIDAKTDNDGVLLVRELNESLGILSDHNVRCFLLIEGVRDIESFTKFSDRLAAYHDDPSYSFSQMKRKGLASLISLGGGASATLWDDMLSAINRRIIYVVDSDRERPGAGLKSEVLDLLKNLDERSTAHVLEKRELENYLSKEIISDAYADTPGFDDQFSQLALAVPDWDYADIPELCAKAMHASLPVNKDIPWSEVQKENRDRAQSRAKKRLARLFDDERLVADQVSSQGELAKIVELIRAVVKDAESDIATSLIQELSTPHPVLGTGAKDGI